MRGLLAFLLLLTLPIAAWADDREAAQVAARWKASFSRLKGLKGERLAQACEKTLQEAITLESELVRLEQRSGRWLAARHRTLDEIIVGLDAMHAAGGTAEKRQLARLASQLANPFGDGPIPAHPWCGTGLDEWLQYRALFLVGEWVAKSRALYAPLCDDPDFRVVEAMMSARALPPRAWAAKVLELSTHQVPQFRGIAAARVRQLPDLQRPFVISNLLRDPVPEIRKEVLAQIGEAAR